MASGILNTGCSSAPKLSQDQIRPWSSSLENEYPNKKAVLAHYHKGSFDLFYLAARHSNAVGSDTLNLVNKLFSDQKFNALLIESIPNSSGESPKWFLDEAKKGQSETFISGGESALAVILADQKQIPFFAGEPDHQDIYKALRLAGYSAEDVLGFYVVRQVPQWVREHDPSDGLLQNKVPSFLTHYCKMFVVSSCPNLKDILAWYKSKTGKNLSPDVSNEEVAPISDGTLFTQRMSTEVGNIRDHFTLQIIEQMLAKYHRLAVIYGAGHFITLRKSFDAALGAPTFTEDTNANEEK